MTKPAANDPTVEKPDADEWWAHPERIRQLHPDDQRILSSKKPYIPFYKRKWFWVLMWAAALLYWGRKLFGVSA